MRFHKYIAGGCWQVDLICGSVSDESRKIFPSLLHIFRRAMMVRGRGEGRTPHASHGKSCLKFEFNTVSADVFLCTFSWNSPFSFARVICLESLNLSVEFRNTLIHTPTNGLFPEYLNEISLDDIERYIQGSGISICEHAT